MSMRWMKLEAQPSVPSFYFLLFSWNKVKIVFSCLFSELSVQYKNTPKIKVLQMPWNLNKIFSRIFENIWHWEHIRGSKHLATRVQGAPTHLGTPPASWAPRGPPPLIPAPTHFVVPQKKSPHSSNSCSSSFCCHFRYPCSKLHSQNCFGRLFFGMWLLQWSN